MKCTFCDNEMMIRGNYIRVRGDDSSEAETVVEQVLQYECRNPKCSRKKETVEQAVRIY